MVRDFLGTTAARPSEPRPGEGVSRRRSGRHPRVFDDGVRVSPAQLLDGRAGSSGRAAEITVSLRKTSVSNMRS
ncbi:Hypothetical predicted protein [Xyrichtys novacula]|uniref:Uncharacterized protein n=1 Tax=Xyrichtys novacula TaxID=13765 RepID=A0AAV1GWE2_XYRNO|nr:Hypothetical predicted protein [Xyrichtys novacula]